VQVDPITPILEPPGTQRLKVMYNELLSSFAFKFNLHRYIKAEAVVVARLKAEAEADEAAEATRLKAEAEAERAEAGAYTRSQFSST